MSDRWEKYSDADLSADERKQIRYLTDRLVQSEQELAQLAALSKPLVTAARVIQNWKLLAIGAAATATGIVSEAATVLKGFIK